ncbi:MAG: DegT/DnrJ/EryC1/StrS family aminotransferase [Planctomycetota bacterium]
MNPVLIPLSRPDLDDSDREAVARVLDGDVLSLGEESDLFEAEFVEFLGEPRHAATVSSGTAGLYLALRALGVDGGTVLTPSYGFVGTAHAIELAGAKPRFVEVDPQTLVVDVETLEAAWTPEVTAIIPVHLFGTPPPMAAICEWAASKNIPVIEDSCEAIGGLSGGRACGTAGDVSVFAFYPNKQMTTGEGGMVVARDPEVAATIRSLRNQGRGPGEFEFTSVGFNFRLTEMQCALGRSQLRRLPTFIALRQALAEEYAQDLSEVSGISLLRPTPPGDRRSWFVFPVLVDDPADRPRLREALAEVGAQTALYFRAIHTMTPYADSALRGVNLDQTESIAQRSFAIPFFNRLPSEDRRIVVDTISRTLAGRPASSLTA